MTFKVGNRVVKEGGDYFFEGWIVAVFEKRKGAVRYVVEDKRGLLMIMNEQMLKPWDLRRGRAKIGKMGATMLRAAVRRARRAPQQGGLSHAN